MRHVRDGRPSMMPTPDTRCKPGCVSSPSIRAAGAFAPWPPNWDCPPVQYTPCWWPPSCNRIASVSSPSAPTLILKPSCWTLSGCISIPRKMLWCYAWMRNPAFKHSTGPNLCCPWEEEKSVPGPTNMSGMARRRCWPLWKSPPAKSSPVQDNMEFTEGVGLYNIIHETQEVYRGPAVPDMGDDFAGGDFQSGQQRLRAMPDIFVGPGTDFSCSQGQQRLGPVECLNAGFLIHA